jgi:hypothetical protein
VRGFFLCSRCGVLISGLFGEGTNYFSGTTTVSNCDLIRTGGYDSNTPGWWAGLRLAMNSAGVTTSRTFLPDRHHNE